MEPTPKTSPPLPLRSTPPPTCTFLLKKLFAYRCTALKFLTWSNSNTSSTHAPGTLSFLHATHPLPADRASSKRPPAPPPATHPSRSRCPGGSCPCPSRRRRGGPGRPSPAPRIPPRRTSCPRGPGTTRWTRGRCRRPPRLKRAGRFVRC